jgi:hypothetical protein
MKQLKLYRIFNLVRWSCIGLAIFSQLSWFVPNVAAQDPTPVPTPTPAPTWTPGPGATETPAPGVPTGPTPIATSTPDNRLIDFRVDEDEIDEGNCVQFSWLVRGDIDRVEFDEVDDDKDPGLVSAQDDREECPDNDTEYELIVRWLDGTKTTRNIEIEVNSGDSGDGSGGSGGSDGQSTTSDTVGSFVPVTPIALNSLTPEPEVASDDSIEAEAAIFQQVTEDDTSGRQLATPAGLLQSVEALPETGAPPAAAEPHRQELWLMFAGGLIILFGSVASLTVLLRFWRQAPDQL